MRSTLTRGWERRVVTLALLAGGAVLLFALLAQPAGAYSSYKHKTATSCLSCHTTGDTGVPPTDADCAASGCHTGGFVSRQTGATSTRTCWTCHDPGQDMAAVQSASGCGTAAAGAACHNQAAHFGSTAATCVSCHGTVQAGNNPGTSAHHNNTAYSVPTCGTCHTTLHEAYVPGVSTCSTCHGGYETVHPNPTTVAAPAVVLAAKPAIVKYGLTTIVSGSVKSGTTGLVGKTVVLQAKPLGSADFAGAATATTGADGAYAFVAQSPTMLTTYRVVTYGGVVNTTVVKPSLKNLDVKVRPDLVISLSRTSFTLGGKQVIKGKLNPARTGGLVKLTIQRKVSGVWKTQLTKSVALTAGSGYTVCSYSYKPLKRGSYRVKASIAATAELAAFTTPYKTWTVK